MTFSYITTHFPPGDPTYQEEGRLESEDDLIPYLNNQIGDHTFDDYFYEDLADPGDASGDWDYATDVADAIDAKGELTEDEAIICFHAQGEWGYGVAGYYNNTSVRCFPIAVYAGGFNTEWETRGFVWHEFGHSAADHTDAEYDTDSDIDIKNITPMAMSYLQDKEDDWDTNYANYGSDTPGPFCYDEPNESNNIDVGNKKGAHDLNRFSGCTLGKLDDTWN
ncbi:MAG: hypothetical protein ABEI75_04955 [Halobaculum sp.]